MTYRSRFLAVLFVLPGILFSSCADLNDPPGSCRRWRLLVEAWDNGLFKSDDDIARAINEDFLGAGMDERWMYNLREAIYKNDDKKIEDLKKRGTDNCDQFYPIKKTEN